MKSLKEFILESNQSLVDSFPDLKRFAKRLSKSDIKLSAKVIKWVETQLGIDDPYILDTSGLLDRDDQVSLFLKSVYREYGYAYDEKKLEITKDKDFKLDSFEMPKKYNNTKVIVLDNKEDRYIIL